MKALPQAIAGRKLPHRNHGGEIERRNAGDHAQGLTQRVDVDAGTGAFGVFALHQVGNADSELDDLKAALNVALGVGNGLAVLARQNVGELVVVALRQFEELHHHARPALRIGCDPLWLSSAGILDGCAQLRLGGERDLGLDVAGHRLENISKPAGGARNLTAANEMPDLTHAFLREIWVRILAGVPVLTFACRRGGFVYECQNQRDPSKYSFQ